MGWMVDYPKLDDDQKDFVDHQINKKGNIWIQGFAGSGKSVMLIHAMRVKLRENPQAKACIVVYTHSLRDMFGNGIKEIDPNNIEGLQNVPIITYHQFKNTNEIYDYVFCDEVQDLPEEVLKMMRDRSSHVFVAGDSNQSIYEYTVSPDQIGDVLSARPFILNRVYRLTRNIMAAVSRLIPSLDIFGAKRDMTKVDVDIRLRKFINAIEEVKFIWETASEASAEGYSSVVLLPRHTDIQSFVHNLCKIQNKPLLEIPNNKWQKPDYSILNNFFAEHNIKAEYIGNNFGSFQNAEEKRNVIIMTYHSAKGMDFNNVFLPFLTEDLSIGKPDGSNSETVFMVALTRSNTNLYLTYSGNLHPLVNNFKDICRDTTPKNNSNNGAAPTIDW